MALASLPSRRAGIRSLVLSATVVILGCPGVSQADSPPRLDPSQVGWTEVRLTGSKFFLTAETVVAASTRARSVLEAQLRAAPEGRGIPLAPETLEILYDSTGGGRRSTVTLWMDPSTGAAIQQTSHDSRGKLRLRTYRFTDVGAYQWTRWPEAGEESLPPARWTKTSEGMRRYPDALPGRAVLETTGLIYAIAAADLKKPGQKASFEIFSRRDTHSVVAEVRPPRKLKVAYDENWPKSRVRRNGSVTALPITLLAQPRPGEDPDDELEVLGLRGQIELLLDPDTRTPLQLSGKVKVLGNVTLKLTSVRLR